MHRVNWLVYQNQQAARIYQAYGEADVDVMLAEKEKERKLKQEEIPEVDDNVDPMSLLDNFYNGNKTIVQDYHHVNQLLSKYDFDVKKDTEAVIDSRSGTYSRRNKLVITRGMSSNAHKFNILCVCSACLVLRTFQI